MSVEVLVEDNDEYVGDSYAGNFYVVCSRNRRLNLIKTLSGLELAASAFRSIGHSRRLYRRNFWFNVEEAIKIDHAGHRVGDGRHRGSIQEIATVKTIAIYK